MGEYAIRKSDGERIKIGTCESMYYLRFEDRDKVTPQAGNVDPMRDAGELLFRLPFPDEDQIGPGNYQDYNRGLRLTKKVILNAHTVPVSFTWEDFADKSTVEFPGIMQLRHEGSGLLLNVPCYHGVKLPDVVKPMQAFWNGKGHSLELSALRGVMEDGELHVYPVVRCRHCDQAWRYQWADIWDYISDPVLRERFAPYKDVLAEASM